MVDAPPRTPAFFSYAVAIGVMALTLSPLLPGSLDSFPLSTYPMFARPRDELTLHALIAVAPDGSEQPIGPELLAGGEVLQAKALIQNSVARGPRAMAELCELALQRIAAGSKPKPGVFVELVRQRYRPLDYFLGARRPLERHSLQRCGAPPTGAAAEPASSRAPRP
jgi:hypothetical protein